MDKSHRSETWLKRSKNKEMSDNFLIKNHASKKIKKIMHHFGKVVSDFFFFSPQKSFVENILVPRENIGEI